MVIKSFRWKVVESKNRTSQGLEMPKLKMEILDFNIYMGGNGTLPIYFEDTVEVGWGKDDGEAQRVLRKWFFGEYVCPLKSQIGADSSRSYSENEKSFENSQPEAGPSRLPVSSVNILHCLVEYESDHSARKSSETAQLCFTGGHHQPLRIPRTLSCRKWCKEG